MKQWVGVIFLMLAKGCLFGQGAYYWSQNFNEESSLLSGAVVGGGAGNASVYYNPAAISESKSSSLAINASLFSLNIFSVRNALGDDINLSSTKIVIQPRFISYNYVPRKAPKFSFEFVVMNTQLIELKFDNSVQYYMDILKSLPGDERYIANFSYSNYFREDWIGGGASYALNDHFYLGTSMFARVKTIRYNYLLDIQAHPLQDTVNAGGTEVPFYSASNNQYQFLTLNNYRMVWKLSMFYKKNRFSCGLSITTPSVNVYSDGKRVSKKIEQSNISNPEGEGFLPNIMIIDYRDKDGMNVNYKDPLSIAAGFVIKSADDKKALYSTIEYFFPIDAYKIVQVDANPLISDKETYEGLSEKEFLSFWYGNRWVLNAAVGFQWTPRENLRMLGGFRTDFNYQNDFDYGELMDYNSLKQMTADLYHITGGAIFTIKGQDIMFGLQYSVGVNRNQEQIISFTDPVEYNTVERAALQGTRTNSMNQLASQLGLFFGAKFNFMGGKESD